MLIHLNAYHITKVFVLTQVAHKSYQVNGILEDFIINKLVKNLMGPNITTLGK